MVRTHSRAAASSKCSRSRRSAQGQFQAASSTATRAGGPAHLRARWLAVPEGDGPASAAGVGSRCRGDSRGSRAGWRICRRLPWRAMWKYRPPRPGTQRRYGGGAQAAYSAGETLAAIGASLRQAGMAGSRAGRHGALLEGKTHAAIRGSVSRVEPPRTAHAGGSAPSRQRPGVAVGRTRGSG